MTLPRVVKVKLIHGRSVPVSIGGKMDRMRVGDELIIPYQVYLRHAWKMELVGDSIGQVQTAIMEGEQVQSAPTQVTQPVVEVPPDGTKEETVPLWDLQVSPEEYINLYGKRKNPSHTIKKRLELARKLTEG